EWDLPGSADSKGFSWLDDPNLYFGCDRLILSMVNEAAMCLGEGVAASPEQVDVAMVFGTGWAPHRGGPLRYADTVGVKEVVRLLTDLQGKFGLRFEPCAELRHRAESGESFFKPPAEVVQASVRAGDELTV